jgi:branched-chain amino acid transport system substrate-binding protein
MSARFRRLVAAAIAAGALLAAGPVRAADPYEVNVILSLTGTAGFVGQANLGALNALEKLVNQTGGINGQPLKFVVSDDQSNPQTAVQVANGILAKKPVAVLGSDLTAICNAVAPLFKDGPLLYCLSSGVRPAPGGWLFGNFTPTNDAIAVVLRYCRERGWNKLAFITSNDATGRDADESIDDDLALPVNKGLTRVAHEHFGTTDLAVTAQISRIKAAGPQALVVWTSGTPFGTISSGVTQVGLTAPVIALGSNASFAEMKQFASVLPHELYFTATLPVAGGDVRDRDVRNAIDAMNKAMLASGAPNDFVNEIPWDPAALVVAALRKLGPNVTPQQLKDYVSGLRGWPGINGRYDFVAHPQRGLDVNTWVMVRWDAAKNYWTGVSKPGGGLR